MLHAKRDPDDGEGVWINPLFADEAFSDVPKHTLADRADVGSGGNGGYRDEHPDERAGSGFGERQDPDDPRKHSDDDREHVGSVDQVRYRSETQFEEVRRESGGPNDDP